MIFNVSLNMKTIPFEKYKKDFTFIINGKRYETSRFEADLISPIVRNYHYLDETISEFTINSKLIKDSEETNNDYFLIFLNSLKTGNQINDSEHQEQYINLFFQLGNSEENSIFQSIQFDELTPDNIICRLKMTTKIIKNLKKSKRDDNEDQYSSNFLFDSLQLNKMIQYASSHFDQISKKEMEKLDDNIIEEIVSNESLKIESEDSLFKFILHLYEKNSKYSYLFEYVYFNNISQISFEKFIDKFSIENLNSNIWCSICERILPSQKEEQLNGRYLIEKCVTKFKHKRGVEFNGIINFLNNKFGGNSHDKRIIEITSNSIFSTCLPKNLIDFKNDNFYYSHNDQKAFICFDFKDKKVQLSGYSIKSCNFDPNDYHLKNWVVEVSNDKKNWEEVDEHHDDQTLNKSGIVATFKAKFANNFYRFIRLRQTGTNWFGDYHIRFSKIEFYGNLKEPITK